MYSMNVLNGNDRGTIKVAILATFFVVKLRVMLQWSRITAFND